MATIIVGRNAYTTTTNTDTTGTLYYTGNPFTATWYHAREERFSAAFHAGFITPEDPVQEDEREII